LPPYEESKNTRRGVGIKGLLEDLLAVLPTDKLLDLFQEKQESSPDFKALVDAIRSPEFEVNIKHLNFTCRNVNQFLLAV
jgi:hypothetical protein